MVGGQHGILSTIAWNFQAGLVSLVCVLGLGLRPASILVLIYPRGDTGQGTRDVNGESTSSLTLWKLPEDSRGHSRMEGFPEA